MADNEEAAAEVEPEAQPPTPFQQVMNWIEVEPQPAGLLERHFGDLTAFADATEKDVRDNLAELAKRRTAATRVELNLKLQFRFLGVYHLVQDRVVRMSEGLDLGVYDQESFLLDIAKSLSAAKGREQQKAGLQARAEAASPGPLKKEPEWSNWEQGVLNMLNIMRGITGVPLAYVIRESDHQDGDTYGNLDAEYIAKAPLIGEVFEADSKVVHETLTNMTNGHDSNTWIREHKSKNNGRLDM
jgi:hypothetical protein